MSLIRNVAPSLGCFALLAFGGRDARAATSEVNVLFDNLSPFTLTLDSFGPAGDSGYPQQIGPVSTTFTASGVEGTSPANFAVYEFANHGYLYFYWDSEGGVTHTSASFLLVNSANEPAPANFKVFAVAAETNSAWEFEYVAPQITSIAETGYPGDTLTLSGTDLYATDVTLSVGHASTSISCLSTSECTAIVPPPSPLDAGKTGLPVSFNTYGYSIPAGQFTYVYLPPTPAPDCFGALDCDGNEFVTCPSVVAPFTQQFAASTLLSNTGGQNEYVASPGVQTICNSGPHNDAPNCQTLARPATPYCPIGGGSHHTFCKAPTHPCNGTCIPQGQICR